MSLIHRYQSNGYNIVLDINSGCIHLVDEVTYEVLPYLEEGMEADAIAEKLGDRFKKEDVETSVTECKKLKEQGMLFTKDIYENIIDEFTKNRQTVVKALCLHIAHDCNLACRYCFAEEGEYHGRRALMSFEVGKKALDFLIANSGSRKNLEVDFFGGEPLMNWQVVKDLVKYGREQEKLHNKKFRFTLTTNGVFVIEVKNRGTQSGTRYEYDIDGNERKIVNGTSYQSGETEETPVQQLRREKRAVEYFLKQNLVNDVPVIPIMVNANPNVTYFSENEIVMCNGIRNLKKQIYNCCSNILISKEDFSFIGEKLFEVQNKIIKKYVPITLYCIDDNKAYIYQDDEAENKNIMTEELKNAIVYYNSEALEDKIKIKFDNSKKPRLFSIKYLMEQGLLELEK